MRGHVTAGSVQGLREAQEDRFVVSRFRDRGWLLAVFDGHNGPGTADVAAGLVEDAFAESFDRYGPGTAAVSATIGKLRDATADRVDGSSASVVFVDEEADRVFVAVLGDSPVIVRDADGELRSGPIHNTGTNPTDAERAIERGALLVGPYLVRPDKMEGVNLTRTIGDADLTFLGRTPEMLDATVGADSFVLVASDGVFTRLAATPEMLVARFGQLIDGETEAEALIADALAAGSDDNVTVVLWKGAE